MRVTPTHRVETTLLKPQVEAVVMRRGVYQIWAAYFNSAQSWLNFERPSLVFTLLLQSYQQPVIEQLILITSKSVREFQENYSSTTENSRTSAPLRNIGTSINTAIYKT